MGPILTKIKNLQRKLKSQLSDFLKDSRNPFITKLRRWYEKPHPLFCWFVKFCSEHEVSAYTGYFTFCASIFFVYFLPDSWAEAKLEGAESSLGYLTVYFGIWIFFLSFCILIITQNAFKLLGERELPVRKLAIYYTAIILVYSEVYLWFFLIYGNDMICGFYDYDRTLLSSPESVLAGQSLYYVEITKVILDSVHFSIVTSTTVGYGDMYPVHNFVKIMVDIQILITVGIVTLGLSRLGRATNVKQNEPTELKPIPIKDLIPPKK